MLRILFIAMVLISIFLLSGCGDASPARSDRGVFPTEAGKPKRASEEQIKQAEQVMTALETDLANLKHLPASERRQKEIAFGKRLGDALDTTANTRFENKNLYWLAYWRFTYGEVDGVEGLLDRLDTLESPAMKSSGDFLRVQVRLRQGRITEARALAQPLVDKVPEFSPLMDLVLFYERVGQSAPHVPSRNLNGGPEDPLTGHQEPWLLYVFVESVDDNTIDLIKRYQLSLGGIEPAGQVRVVLVTFGANPLNEAARVRSDLGGMDLLWANPSPDGGNASTWKSVWHLPLGLPKSVLLGPDRSIMAVEIGPEILAMLLGKKK